MNCDFHLPNIKNLVQKVCMKVLVLPVRLQVIALNHLYKLKVADLSPIHLRKLSATDGTKLDLNIGESIVWRLDFSGQIYNPETGGISPNRQQLLLKLKKLKLDRLGILIQLRAL